MRKRNGYSLIEVLTVFALIGVILTVVSTSTFRLGRIERRLSSHWEGERILERFARHFRNDVHRARRATVGATDDPVERDKCRLDLADEESIRYRIDGATVHREHWQDDNLRHRDSFVMPQLAEFRWQIDQVADAEIVSILFTRKSLTQLAAEANAPERLDAVLALHPGELPVP